MEVLTGTFVTMVGMHVCPTRKWGRQVFSSTPPFQSIMTGGIPLLCMRLTSSLVPGSLSLLETNGTPAAHKEGEW